MMKLRYKTTYTIVHALMASPTEPMPERLRTHQLGVMWKALEGLRATNPSNVSNWRICSDAVNMMETLIEGGLCEDPDNLVADAITSLAMSGKRHIQKNEIYLDGPGMVHMRLIIESYEAMLCDLPHRTMIHCHIKTEKRMQDIFKGRRRAHDIEMVAV